MEDHERQRQLSLIPYPSEQREVVLRHGNSVVVFDQQAQELSLRDTSHEDATDFTDCPYCHRPFQDERSSYHTTQDARSESPDHGFVNPNYFRMLAHSTPGSRESSAPPTPRRGLQFLRSGGSRNVSNASGPPSGAEFVGSNPAPQPTGSGIKGSSFTPGYFERFFVEVKELGRGGRGVVLLVKHILDGVPLGDFACKRIPVGNDHGWLEKVLVEVQLLQSLNHPNLVSYRHVWLEDAQITNFGPSVPCVFILQQFCNAGDLQGYVHEFRPEEISNKEQLKQRHRRKSSIQQDLPNAVNAIRHMPLDEIFSFFKDITAGLHHLHASKYIHRDLKPSNCLLHRDAQGKTTVHVSDFGEVQSATAVRASTGATGTISYCAPEVLQHNPSSQTYGAFTTKSDIFSLGLILHFMCFSTLPYIHAASTTSGETEDATALRAEISAWRGFDATAHKTRADLPEQLYAFLKRLLSLDPDERPSTGEILASISRGGVEDLRPPQSPIRDDIHPRFSAVDSPAPERVGLRKRNSLTRPGMRLRGSSDDARRGGEIERDSSSPGSPKDAVARMSSTGVVRSTRKVVTPAQSSTPVPAKDRPTSPQSPRLMLPPPEPRVRTWEARIRSVAEDAVVIRTLKAMVFLLKIWVLYGACAPYTARGWVLYPLLAVAVVDVAVVEGSLVMSGALLAAHMVIVWWLQSIGRLCARPGFKEAMNWHE
ncbi:hypothetical protein MBLNU457_4558t1 [Dothideomycetes sp. NU457]